MKYSIATPAAAPGPPSYLSLSLALSPSSTLSLMRYPLVMPRAALSLARVRASRAPFFLSLPPSHPVSPLSFSLSLSLTRARTHTHEISLSRRLRLRAYQQGVLLFPAGG